jgi:hypothetical protein
MRTLTTMKENLVALDVATNEEKAKS